MSFKVADGYVEVHARHDRASTRRNARQAVDDAENEAKKREGSMLRWLFKTNPKLMKMLEAPIGSIFGSPVIFAAAAVLATGLVGLLSTALTTAILGGIAGGFIAGGAWVHANDKAVVGAYVKMKDKIRGVFYRASQPIVGPLINAMGMIGDKFKEMEPAFTRIYKALAPLIEPFTGGILGFIEAMLPGIERAMPGIQTVMLTLAEHMPGLGTAIGDFFATLAENGPLLERVVGLMITWLENFFKVAGPILVFWMEGFAFWADAWNGLTDGIKKGMEWLTKAWDAIPGLWDRTWGAVSGFFSNLGNDIGGFFSGLWTTITTWWDDTANSIGDWWSRTWGSITTWFSELPGRIGEFLSSLPGTVAGWFGQAFDTVTYMIGFAIGTWVRTLIQFPFTVRDGLVAGFQTWLAAVTWIVNFIYDWITGGWTRVWNFTNEWGGRMLTFFTSWGQRIIAWAVNLFTQVLAWWNQLPGRLWQAAQDAASRVMGAFNWLLHEGPQAFHNLQMRVINAVIGLGAQLWNVGQDAIRGLINGIGSMMDWAVDMAWRAARNIAEGFMDALGIGSPSKYFRDEVGKWIPAGIQVGIEDNMGDLDRFAKDFPGDFGGAMAMRPPLAGNTTSNDNSTNYGGIQMTVHVDNIQELEDIKKFLDGQMRTDPKARAWAGNLYEQQGEYVRSYQ